MFDELYLVTSNLHKVDELSPIFKKVGITLKQLKIGKLEIQSDNVEEISHFAARVAFEMTNKPLIVDDTGLFIDVLNGFPGPFAHYVLDTIGRSGILKLLINSSDRNAKFITAATICTPTTGCKTFTGVLEGNIALEERGNFGFGYDSIFIPKGLNSTLAELPLTKKIEISHRTLAFRQIINWIQSLKLEE